MYKAGIIKIDVLRAGVLKKKSTEKRNEIWFKYYLEHGKYISYENNN